MADTVFFGLFFRWSFNKLKRYQLVDVRRLDFVVCQKLHIICIYKSSYKMETCCECGVNFHSDKTHICAHKIEIVTTVREDGKSSYCCSLCGKTAFELCDMHGQLSGTQA